MKHRPKNTQTNRKHVSRDTCNTTVRKSCASESDISTSLMASFGIRNVVCQHTNQQRCNDIIIASKTNINKINVTLCLILVKTEERVNGKEGS